MSIINKQRIHIKGFNGFNQTSDFTFCAHIDLKKLIERTRVHPQKLLHACMAFSADPLLHPRLFHEVQRPFSLTKSEDGSSIGKYGQ